MNANLKTPYKPSWVDRYFDWIDSLPIPNWLFYLLLFLLTVNVANLPYWIEGLQPWFTFTAAASIGGIWLPAQQGVTHLIDHSAKAALTSFRPAMKAEEGKYESLLFTMQNLPALPIAIITFLIIGTISIASLLAPGILGGAIQSTAGKTISALGFITGFIFGPILLYSAFRQVRLVKYAYTLTGEINLFKLQPLYSLSSLTAKIVIAITLLAPLNYLQNIVLTSYGLGPGFVIGMTSIGAFIVFSAFFVPLWATHVRIVEKKEEQLAKNGDQISKLVDRLDKQVEKNSLEEMEQLEKGIGALMRVRESIEKTSTWPWDPSTLRGLLSAVMLPIFLFVIQQILVRFL